MEPTQLVQGRVLHTMVQLLGEQRNILRKKKGDENRWEVEDEVNEAIWSESSCVLYIALILSSLPDFSPETL
jgi:hypothetical protein